MPRTAHKNDSPALGSLTFRETAYLSSPDVPLPFSIRMPGAVSHKQGKAELHWTTGASKRPKRQDSGPGSMPLAQSVIPDAV